MFNIIIFYILSALIYIIIQRFIINYLKYSKIFILKYYFQKKQRFYCTLARISSLKSSYLKILKLMLFSLLFLQFEVMTIHIIIFLIILFFSVILKLFGTIVSKEDWLITYVVLVEFIFQVLKVDEPSKKHISNWSSAFINFSAFYNNLPLLSIFKLFVFFIYISFI